MKKKALVAVASALRFSSSSLLLCAFASARDIFFLPRLRAMAPSD
ncbi:MAG: hypothetical protein WBM40_08540 [Thiohalocapsa sp.]